MSQKTHVMHGRDHAADGADPIPGMGGSGIQFDTSNVGGYLNVSTTGDNVGDGIAFNTAAGTLFHVTSGGQIVLNAEDGGINLLAEGAGEAVNITSDDGDVAITADNDAQLAAGDTITLQAFGAGIFLNLPTVAGAAGSLWNDGGTVKVA